MIVQEFSRAEASLPGSSLAWLRQMRKDAIDRFAELGFPTVKQEAWRFTPVDAIAKSDFKLAERASPGALSEQAVRALALGSLEAFQLVFVDGHFAPELSGIPPDVRAKAGSLNKFLETHPRNMERHLGRYADYKTQPFTALNAALFAGGAHVYIPEGTALEDPIHLLFISRANGTPTQTHPRVLIVAEPNAKAAVVETYVGASDHVYWTNAVTEIALGQNAQLDHYKLVRERPSAYHISTLCVKQDRESRFASHAILLGGALVRNNIQVSVGDGAECTLNGLYLVADRQHVDTHTLIDHGRPRGLSREYYKGVLDGKSRAVFDGTVVVEPNAQKTDSMQTNKNLLLSNEAKVDTKPELKIFANDVKCKHGATIGQISPDALFYLRSRGIAREDARRLLIYAFASEMLDRLGIASLREALAATLFEKYV